MTSLFAALREPAYSLTDIMILTAGARDDELVFRLTELLDLLAACSQSTATEVTAEFFATLATLSGDFQQRLTDGYVRAVGRMPGRRRNAVIATTRAALNTLSGPQRDRQLRLLRRAVRLLPPERARAVGERLLGAGAP